MQSVENIIWKARFLEKKNWLEAIKILKEGIIDFPENSELHSLIAKIFNGKKLYSKAIEHYLIAIEFSHYDVDLYFTIGNIYLTIKDPKSAIKFYNKIENDFPEAMYNKSIALVRLMKRDESIEILKKLISEFPKTQIAYYFLVEQLLFKKKYKQSIEYLEKAENVFGKQGKICFLMGLNYFYLKNWIKAYSEFQKAEKLKYDTANFFHIYGLCSEKIGKTESAIELLSVSISKDPFNAMNYIDLANIFIMHRRPKEALEITKMAKKVDPSSIIVTLTLNKLLKSMKEDDENNS